jgi:uncharacterized membrane protein
MIPATLERFERAQRDLIAALDSRDVEALEASVATFGKAVEEVRVQGGWRDHPQIVDQVVQCRALADAAGIRVNFLTDANRQRIEALATARGNIAGGAYRRDGSQDF